MDASCAHPAACRAPMDPAADSGVKALHPMRGALAESVAADCCERLVVLPLMAAAVSGRRCRG